LAGLEREIAGKLHRVRHLKPAESASETPPEADEGKRSSGAEGETLSDLGRLGEEGPGVDAAPEDPDEE